MPIRQAFLEVKCQKKKHKSDFLKNRKFAQYGMPKKKNGIFSVVDVVAVLTNSANPNNYWKVLKNRLKKKEVSWLQIVTN
jgi:hypothetical protein